MNWQLTLMYAGAALFGFAVAWGIWASRNWHHVKAHGPIGGFAEWWLYGRQSNWSKEPVELDDQWGPDLKRAWERGVRVELDAHRDTAIVEGSGVPVAPRRLATVKSIRLNSIELEHVADAAAKRGLTIGQYIKRAAVQQATDDRMQESVTATIGYGHVVAARNS